MFATHFSGFITVSSDIIVILDIIADLKKLKLFPYLNLPINNKMIINNTKDLKYQKIF